MSSCPRKSRSTLWASAFCAVALGGAWFGWSQSGTARAAAALPGELEKARHAGLPTTPDELRTEIRKKNGTNGASDYLAAFARAKSLRTKRASSLELEKFLSGKATPKEIADAKAEIARSAPALADFEVGSRKDLVDYNRSWEQGLMVFFPDLTDARKLANLLCIQALIDPAEAKSIATVSRVARQVGGEPTTISLLFQTWVEQSAIDTLLHLLQKHPDNAELRRAARQALKDLGPFPHVRDHFGGELVLYRLGAQQMTAKYVEELKMSGIDLNIPPQASIMLQFPAYRQANESTMVRFWREMAEGVPKDPEDIAGLKFAMGNVESRYSNRDRADHALLHGLGVFRSDLPDTLGAALARRRVLAGTLDALDYRAKTGAYPKTTSVRDPFSTNPLVYHPTPNGFQLYSLGPDGQDNGGRRKGKDDTTYDIGYGLTRK